MLAELMFALIVGTIIYLVGWFTISLILDVVFEVDRPALSGAISAGCLAVVVAIAGISLHGKVTHEGESTGYVTAVHCGGIMFNTCEVYVKTDLESTQEDVYCLGDKGLREQLRQYAESNTRLEFQYYDVLLWADGCEFSDGNEGVIVGVRPIKELR